jgi:hypothetical protein
MASRLTGPRTRPGFHTLTPQTQGQRSGNRKPRTAFQVLSAKPAEMDNEW